MTALVVLCRVVAAAALLAAGHAAGARARRRLDALARLRRISRAAPLLLATVSAGCRPHDGPTPEIAGPCPGPEVRPVVPIGVLMRGDGELAGIVYNVRGLLGESEARP